MREFVISRGTWQRLLFFGLNPVVLLAFPIDRSIVRCLTKKWTHRYTIDFLLLIEHESISKLEEQFPRMDIPDLDHVRDSLPNMHRHMDNLLPRIVVHNMRLQVTEHRLFERKEGRMVSKLGKMNALLRYSLKHVTTDFVLSIVKRIADVRVPSGRLQEEFLSPLFFSATLE